MLIRKFAGYCERAEFIMDTCTERYELDCAIFSNAYVLPCGCSVQARNLVPAFGGRKLHLVVACYQFRFLASTWSKHGDMKVHSNEFKI